MCRAPTDLSVCTRCAERSRGAAVKSSAHPARPSSLLLDGKYRLLEEVGRGGMGTVFRALDVPLERIVAIKFLLPHLQVDPTLVRLFRSEARAMASVRDENVLQVFAAGTHGDTDFFVAEYVRGVSADEWIAAALVRREHVPLADALHIGCSACRGLAAVHRAGVVHRDIKPGNVMVETETGRVVLMDFGLGQRSLGSSTAGTLINVGGTPAYMAPELVETTERSRELDRAADIYAIGASLFELVTGRPPFQGGSWVETLRLHSTASPPRPSSLRGGLPSGLDEVLLWPLEKDPSKRPPTATALCEVLGGFMPSLRDRDGSRGSVEAPRRRFTPVPRADRSGRPQLVLADPAPGVLAALVRAARLAVPGARVCTSNAAATAVELAARTGADAVVVPFAEATALGPDLAASMELDPRLSRTQVVYSVADTFALAAPLAGVCPMLPLSADLEELSASLREVLAPTLGGRGRGDRARPSPVIVDSTRPARPARRVGPDAG